MLLDVYFEIYLLQLELLSRFISFRVYQNSADLGLCVGIKSMKKSLFEFELWQPEVVQAV